MTTSHPRDPLHGVTLETIVTTLVERHGWAELGRRLPVRCFLNNPSVKSSLTFLRKASGIAGAGRCSPGRLDFSRLRA